MLQENREKKGIKIVKMRWKILKTSLKCFRKKREKIKKEK